MSISSPLQLSVRISSSGSRQRRSIPPALPQIIFFFAVLILDLVEVDQSNVRLVPIQRQIPCFNGCRYTPRNSNLSAHGYPEPLDRREFPTQRFRSLLFKLQFQTAILDDVYFDLCCIVWFACYLSLATMLYFLCCTHNMHGVQRRRQLIWWQWPFKLLFDGVEQ